MVLVKLACEEERKSLICEVISGLKVNLEKSELIVVGLHRM